MPRQEDFASNERGKFKISNSKLKIINLGASLLGTLSESPGTAFLDYFPSTQGNYKISILNLKF